MTSHTLIGQFDSPFVRRVALLIPFLDADEVTSPVAR
jgi:hypothetical protein